MKFEKCAGNGWCSRWMVRLCRRTLWWAEGDSRDDHDHFRYKMCFDYTTQSGLSCSSCCSFTLRRQWFIYSSWLVVLHGKFRFTIELKGMKVDSMARPELFCFFFTAAQSNLPEDGFLKTFWYECQNYDKWC